MTIGFSALLEILRWTARRSTSSRHLTLPSGTSASTRLWCSVGSVWDTAPRRASWTNWNCKVSSGRFGSETGAKFSVFPTYSYTSKENRYVISAFCNDYWRSIDTQCCRHDNLHHYWTRSDTWSIKVSSLSVYLNIAFSTLSAFIPCFL